MAKNLLVFIFRSLVMHTWFAILNIGIVFAQTFKHCRFVVVHQIIYSLFQKFHFVECVVLKRVVQFVRNYFKVVLFLDFQDLCCWHLQFNLTVVSVFTRVEESTLLNLSPAIKVTEKLYLLGISNNTLRSDARHSA